MWFALMFISKWSHILWHFESKCQPVFSEATQFLPRQAPSNNFCMALRTQTLRRYSHVCRSSCWNVGNRHACMNRDIVAREKHKMQRQKAQGWPHQKGDFQRFHVFAQLWRIGWIDIPQMSNIPFDLQEAGSAWHFPEAQVLDVTVVSGKTRQRDIHKHCSNQFQTTLPSKLRLSLVIL